MKISMEIQKYRKGTTTEDTHKKIQTLRTQIGQEISKMEKSREHGDEDIYYNPKVWWFEMFEWVTRFMKGRNDPVTPLSMKLEKSLRNTSPTFDLYDEEGNRILIEEDNSCDEPPIKQRRTDTPKNSNSNIKTNQVPTRTIQYIISNDDSEIISPPDEEIVEIQQQSRSEKDYDRFKKRSKNFGKYVASLMYDIKDDKTYFETQSAILQIIQQASLKKSQK